MGWNESNGLLLSNATYLFLNTYVECSRAKIGGCKDHLSLLVRNTMEVLFGAELHYFVFCAPSTIWPAFSDIPRRHRSRHQCVSLGFTSLQGEIFYWFTTHRSNSGIADISFLKLGAVIKRLSAIRYMPFSSVTLRNISWVARRYRWSTFYPMDV